MKFSRGARFAVLLWLAGVASHLSAQTPVATNLSQIMQENFPMSGAVASPSPAPSPAVPAAAAAMEEPAPLAPMPAGMPTPRPSPVAAPVTTLSNPASLSLGLDGPVDQGIPDPMRMVFPSEPEIPTPAVSPAADPVTSIKLPPASSLELRLTPDAKRLNIDDAIATSLQKNPEVLSSIQQIRLTRGQLVQVRAALLPTLQANSGYNVESDTLANPIAGFGPSNNNQAWNVVIAINQNIWSGWKNQADFSAARLANDSSFYSLRETIDTVVANTKKLFFDVIFNRALIRVREESVAVLQSQLQDQQSRFEAGTVPRFNVLQAEVALANAIPPVIQARNALRISQFALVKQLGLDYPNDPSLVPVDVIGQLDYDPIKLDLGGAVFTALTRNPSLKVQRQNILISKEQLKAALSGFQPTLNATAGYQAFNVPSASQLDQAINGLFVGITGTWNIFDGLATVGATQAARASLQQSMINYDNSARGVELDVQRAVSNLIEAQEVIDSQRANVVQATEALRLSRERLDAGAGTQLDVLNAQVSLLQTQTTELEGRYRYIIALAEYNRVLSLDTVYADTYDDPMLTAKERQRNDLLNTTTNPNPGVLLGTMPDKRDTLRKSKGKQEPPPPPGGKQSGGR